MNYPDGMQPNAIERYYGGDEAAKSQVTLKHYESTATKMIDYVFALYQAGAPVGFAIEKNLQEIWAIFGDCEYAETGDTKETAIAVIGALSQGDTDEAKDEINNHFHGYLVQLREAVG